MAAKGESGVMHASCSDTGRVEHDSPKIWTPIIPIKMDAIVATQAAERKERKMIVLGSMQISIESSVIMHTYGQQT